MKISGDKKVEIFFGLVLTTCAVMIIGPTSNWGRQKKNTTTTVRYKIVDVRSNQFIIQEDGSSAPGAVGGAALGAGTAFVLGGSVATGGLAGAALGSLQPADTVELRKSVCMISAVAPNGKTFSTTWVGNEDAARCTLAKQGDTIIVTHLHYFSGRKEGYVDEDVWKLEPSPK